MSCITGSKMRKNVHFKRMKWMSMLEKISLKTDTFNKEANGCEKRKSFVKKLQRFISARCKLSTACHAIQKSNERKNVYVIKWSSSHCFFFFLSFQIATKSWLEMLEKSSHSKSNFNFNSSQTLLNGDSRWEIKWEREKGEEDFSELD